MRTIPTIVRASMLVVLLLLVAASISERSDKPAEQLSSIAREGTLQGGRIRGLFQPRVEVVATGLEVPWALAFAPDGRLFFTERPGRLRVVEKGQLLPDPVAVLPAVTVAGGEAGLMGLAVDPDFGDNGFLYVMYSYRDGRRQLLNRISRLTVRGSQAFDETVLLEDIPAGDIHDGGRLKFGPDGKLYAATGDSSVPSTAQDPDSLAGKILRLNPNGSIPEDNPFPGSPIFTLGHRNPQGLAFQPETGRLFSTEHGTGANDEVNIIEAGKNYGWPLVQGVARDPRFADPMASYSPTIAPSGATFYQGDRLPGWSGNLFFTTLKGRHIHQLLVGGEGSRQVVAEEYLFEGEFGRLRDVVQGPDGFLYFCTSNRDGRGTAVPEDDRILRIVPE